MAKRNTKLIPFFHQDVKEDLVLKIDAAETAATHDHVVKSRKITMDAQGATNAPTHTLILDAEPGVILFIDFLDSGSLNANSAATDASKVVVKRKGNDDDELTFDDVAEQAIVMFTDTFFEDVSEVFAQSTTAGVFA